MSKIPDLDPATGGVTDAELLLVYQTGQPKPNRKRAWSTVAAYLLGPNPAALRGFFGAEPTSQPSAAAQAAIVDNSGGDASPMTAMSAAAFRQTILLPLELPEIAAGDFKIALPFDFTVVSALFRTAKPASTAAKLATLTASVNGAVVTGGVMALTTANQNAIGGTVAGTTITAGNAGLAGQTIGVTASSVTAFVEGSGWVEFTVLNKSLASAMATQVAQGNAIRSALAALGLIKGAA